MCEINYDDGRRRVKILIHFLDTTLKSLNTCPPLFSSIKNRETSLYVCLKSLLTTT